MANNDLLKWVTSDVDFYELLGITFENCSESELRRAYRKTSLKYHPDKLGKDFNADKYELFQSAYGVLEDAELKTKYDNHRNAKLQRQRANELFEGKRRQMKEDLEARERGEPGIGNKRPRDDTQHEAQLEMRKLAEEGKKRRAARASMMAQEHTPNDVVSPSRTGFKRDPPRDQSASSLSLAKEEEAEEDEIEKLERRIREAEEARAKRKADKRARKSSVFVPADSPLASSSRVKSGTELADAQTTTPIKLPKSFRGLKADDKVSASPRFSFSPAIATPKRNDFKATMERLKVAEKLRLEEEIRKQESAGTI